MSALLHMTAADCAGNAQECRHVRPLLLLLPAVRNRMHPHIAFWPSRHFYQGKLKDGVSSSDKPQPAGLAWPQHDCPVAVVAVEEGQEERASSAGGRPSAQQEQRVRQRRRDAAGADDSEGEGGLEEGPGAASYLNRREAAMSIRLAAALLQAGDVASVACLSPYRGQVRVLEGLRRSMDPQLAAAVEVSSVDAFQGREADVVVFSTVRCNPAGRIGFVSDKRRLNVAITRPRRGLLVLGSPSTLDAGSADWRSYFQWAREQGLVVEGPDGLNRLLRQAADPAITER